MWDAAVAAAPAVASLDLEKSVKVNEGNKGGWG